MPPRVKPAQMRHTRQYTNYDYYNIKMSLQPLRKIIKQDIRSKSSNIMIILIIVI